MTNNINTMSTIFDDMTKNEAAFQLTAYEQWGSVTVEDVKALKIAEDIAPSLSVNNLDRYNEYRAEQGYETYFGWDEFDEMLYGLTPYEVFQRTHYGKISPCDEYMYFNGYGNIESISEGRLEKQMQEDSDFCAWLLESDVDFDEEEAEELCNMALELVKRGF